MKPNKSRDIDRDYKIRLIASLDYIRYLLHQGLSFRDHDESRDSSNRGSFRELLQFLADHNEDISKVILSNASGNQQMVSPMVQKDLVNAAAKETTKAIIEELNNDVFGILVDETRDISKKEQMAIVLRFIDKEGKIKERFIGITHVKDTCSSTLKEGIDLVLSEHGLSISRIRGQGYDGASNMQGEFNDLKTLIMRESSSAYFVHCFARQLQLTLVAVAKNHTEIACSFNWVAMLVNVVGGSNKRQDVLKEKQAKKL